MASPRALTLDFIDRRPAAAGRVLAAMSAEDAAAFLESIPGRFAARALRHMNTWAVASVLATMSPEAAAAALQPMDHRGAAAILRLVPEGPRETILTELPARAQRSFRSTLSFPPDTVGAHMTTAIVTQRPDDTASDAIHQARGPVRADAELLFVVDEQHRLLGVVSPTLLLRAAPSARMDEVMDPGLEPLSARARIAAIRGLEAWDRYGELPVASRQGQLIGALDRRSLRRAGSDAAPGPGDQGPGPLVSLAGALLVTAGGLVALLAAGPHPARRRPYTGDGS